MFSTAKRIASQKGKKRVSFAEGVKEEKEEGLSFFKQFKKPKYSTIQKTWFDYSCEGRYENLKDYLTKCVEQGISIETFFLQEGRLILRAAIDKFNAEPFEFICDNIPQYILKALFTRYTYILEVFLKGEAVLERHQVTTEKMLFSRMKKFALLLKIGTKGLIEQIIENRRDLFPETLKDDFTQAVKDYENDLTDVPQTKFINS